MESLFCLTSALMLKVLLLILLRMILWQQLLILRDSTLKHNLVRLPVPGSPFSVSILQGCFDLLLLPASFLVLLAFLITILTLSSVV